MNGKSHQTERILVCQGRSCRKYASNKILAAFRADLVPGIEVIPTGCLGQCGNGPMVLIEPEGIWYWQVLPEQVPIIIKEHLKAQCPVKTMLYPKFHKNIENL
jgi:(2Fe-2S) ferredoxin